MRALLLGLALGLAGCPGIEKGGAPSSCERFGAKCKLPSGPLGICDRGACPDGQEGTCLRCVPQH